MNARTLPERIPDPAIRDARAAAAAAKRRLVDVLEERIGEEPDVYIARLGVNFRLPVLTMDQLRRSTPAFDLLPFSECACQRNRLVNWFPLHNSR